MVPARREDLSLGGRESWSDDTMGSLEVVDMNSNGRKARLEARLVAVSDGELREPNACPEVGARRVN